MAHDLNKINVFCPVETTSRELDFRLFFAAHCVTPNLRFVIGSQLTVFNLLRELRGGIYLGQNVRPVYQSHPKAKLHARLQELRASGTTLMVLDEEGGVMAGDQGQWTKWLDVRIQAEGLQPHEHVCTWGDWQRDHYRSLSAAPQNIVTTGHPRFDIYKADKNAFYSEEVAHLRQQYGDFVLVNTNFAISNHFMGNEHVFSQNSRFDLDKTHERLDFVNQWSHVSQVCVQMIALVMRISAEWPENNVVLRPHPSENVKFYQDIFQNVANVHVKREGSVGSWLLASRALIHDGCTTAIEAHFCDVPTLTYKPVVNERYDLQLPNALGVMCDHADRVLEVLQTILTHQTQREIQKTPDIASCLMHNFAHDSFASLSSRIQEVAQTAQGSTSGAEETITNSQKRNVFSTAARHLKQRGRPNVPASNDKFSGFDPIYLQQKNQKVQELLNKDVKLNYITTKLFTIEN